MTLTCLNTKYLIITVALRKVYYFRHLGCYSGICMVKDSYAFAA